MDNAFALAEASGVAKFLSTNADLILFSGVVVAAYALFRLTQVRDADGQKLPHSFTAKLFFVLTHIVAYLFILGFCLYSPNILSKLPGGFPDAIPDELRQQLPLIAVIAVGALLTIPQIKDLDREYAILLHSAQHKRADEDALRVHLASCPFRPSSKEIEEGLAYLRQFDIYITDSDAGMHLDSVDTWQKVGSLLRMLKGEALRDNTVLSPADRQEIVRLDEAHFRKTKLAASLMRILDHMERGSQYGQRLTRVANLLGDASHRDRYRIGLAEDVAQQIMNEIELAHAAGTDSGHEPLRLSSQQVQQYVVQIESYLKAEYQLMLQNASRLAAKMIVRAGDRAPEQLDEAKDAGFLGLGEIQEVNLDRVILVILATFPTVFFFFTLGALWSGRPARPELYISIATTISIAALIGAMWGSRRRFAQSREIPWSSYLGAGLVAVLGFIIVQCTRYFIDPAGVNPGDNATIELGQYLGSVLPWSASAAFVTIGICGLARVAEWPWFKTSAVVERSLDGLFLGLAYAIGQLAAYMFHAAFKTGFGIVIVKKLGEGDLDWIWSSSVRGFLIGFIMGFFIVRDVRRVSHSHVVEGRPREEPQPSAEAQVYANGAEEARAENGAMSSIAEMR
jgi:chemotaxis regulatin CheY-phosphate phosphatase CheZ